jgi:membrane-bound inhibitor of C-type lysozyme
LSKKRLAIQENLVYDAIPILKAEVWFMCKEKEITVLKVSPHKKPKVVTLKNELSALQEAVSSGVKDYHHLIQLVGAEEGVDLLLNDEGTFLSRPRSARSLC